MEAKGGEPSNRIRKHQRAPSSNRFRKHQRVESSSESQVETSESQEEEGSNQIRRHQRVVSSSESEMETPEEEEEESEEETDGSLLVLNNRVETLGNVVSLSRIGPSKDRSFLYELTAKDEADRRSSLRLQSFMKSRPKWVDSPASSRFLMVPSQFSCTSRQLQFDLCFPGYRPGTSL